MVSYRHLFRRRGFVKRRYQNCNSIELSGFDFVHVDEGTAAVFLPAFHFADQLVWQYDVLLYHRPTIQRERKQVLRRKLFPHRLDEACRSCHNSVLRWHGYGIYMVIFRHNADDHIQRGKPLGIPGIV